MEETGRLSVRSYMSQILKFDQGLEMKIQHNSNSSMQVYWTFNILR